MEITVTDLDDLPEETRKVAEKAQKLRTVNANLSKQIESLGGGVDAATARVEHMLLALANLGVITEHQMWEIHLDWEKGFREQLKTIKQKLIELHNKARQAAGQQQKQPDLVAPQGKLWTPGG